MNNNNIIMDSDYIAESSCSMDSAEKKEEIYEEEIYEEEDTGEDNDEEDDNNNETCTSFDSDLHDAEFQPVTIERFGVFLGSLMSVVPIGLFFACSWDTMLILLVGYYLYGHKTYKRMRVERFLWVLYVGYLMLYWTTFVETHAHLYEKHLVFVKQWAFWGNDLLSVINDNLQMYKLTDVAAANLIDLSKRDVMNVQNELQKEHTDIFVKKSPVVDSFTEAVAKICMDYYRIKNKDRSNVFFAEPSDELTKAMILVRSRNSVCTHLKEELISGDIHDLYCSFYLELHNKITYAPRKSLGCNAS